MSTESKTTWSGWKQRKTKGDKRGGVPKMGLTGGPSEKPINALEKLEVRGGSGKKGQTGFGGRKGKNDHKRAAPAVG